MTFGRHAEVQKILDFESSNFFSDGDDEFICEFIHFTERLVFYYMNKRGKINGRNERRGFIDAKGNCHDKISSYRR